MKVLKERRRTSDDSRWRGVESWVSFPLNEPDQEAAMKTYLATLVCAVLVVGVFEWRTDEDTVTLLVLLTASCGLGALRPKLFWLTAIAVGSVIAALNLLTAVTGFRPIYETAAQTQAHSTAYGVSLMVLVLPALAAAALGAFVRRSASETGAAA
jgi:hypothetical protein